MKKRFIISLGAGFTEAQENAFMQYIKGANLTWWHWIRGLWLIVDEEGTHKASTIRDKVQECFPKVRTMVFELKGEGRQFDTWSGHGPKTPEKNMFEWIKENW